MEIKTIWVNEDSPLPFPYRVADISLIAVFPVFNSRLPNETAAGREARWKASYQEIGIEQRKYIKMQVLYAFYKTLELSRYADRTALTLLDKRISGMCDELSALRANIHTRFTTNQYENCIELTFQYTLRSMHHCIHVCNLSPSEYANLP